MLDRIDAKNLLALIARVPSIAPKEIEIYVEVRAKLRDMVAGVAAPAVVEPADGADVQEA